MLRIIQKVRWNSGVASAEAKMMGGDVEEVPLVRGEIKEMLFACDVVCIILCLSGPLVSHS